VRDWGLRLLNFGCLDSRRLSILSFFNIVGDEKKRRVWAVCAKEKGLGGKERREGDRTTYKPPKIRFSAAYGAFIRLFDAASVVLSPCSVSYCLVG